MVVTVSSDVASAMPETDGFRSWARTGHLACVPFQRHPGDCASTGACTGSRCASLEELGPVRDRRIAGFWDKTQNGVADGATVGHPVVRCYSTGIGPAYSRVQVS